MRQGLVYVGSALWMSVLCALGGEARVSVGGVEVFVRGVEGVGAGESGPWTVFAIARGGEMRRRRSEMGPLRRQDG